MIPKFDINGNLPRGLIKPKLTDFKARFVNEFKESNTRIEIFNGYLEYCSKILMLDIASLQWVNGSFTTNKMDPKDIDFVTHVDGIKVDNLTKTEQEMFEKLNDYLSCLIEYRCDSFFIFVYPPECSDLYDDMLEDLKYWSKWFSHDRIQKPKGLIEFNLSDSSFNISSCNGSGGID